MKNTLLLLVACIASLLSYAQIRQHDEYVPPVTPAMELMKQQMTEQIITQLNKSDWSNTNRTTSGAVAMYTIPVVVHVLHLYGSEDLMDNVIYHMIDTINSYFLKKNADTINIIDKYKPLATSTQIAFKLANYAPDGSPTKGIEHIYTYLTIDNITNNPDMAKISQWPPEHYLNIWLVNNDGLSIGYPYSSVSAASYPYYDGIMAYYNIPYEPYFLAMFAAQYLNLPFTYNYTAGCNDGDGIPDTPPCSILNNCSNLYDTLCDTPNVQNIMNMSTCNAHMFTYGQGLYMQNVLHYDYGHRDSLVTPYNYAATGMDQPMADLPPVPDFYVFMPSGVSRFFCQGQAITFKNASWNDTITNVSWTFSNNPVTPTSTAIVTVNNRFHQPGWATVTLSATGNNSGTSTLVRDSALYIADSIATSGQGYVEEFDPSGGLGEWPIFNYFNNSFKWEFSGTGYTDHFSLKYSGYDLRPPLEKMTGTPAGDVDDIYTPAFDLSGFTDSCHLNFMSSGATSTTRTKFMNDSLEIYYSANHAASWTKLIVLGGYELDNQGYVGYEYAPSTTGDWVPHSITLPAAAITPYTLFQFRYAPGSDSIGMSTGNNFYIDHFNFSLHPESIVLTERMTEGITLTPNPSHGDCTVNIKAQSRIGAVAITVTDISGRIIFVSNNDCDYSQCQIQLPSDVFKEKGLYLIHITTNNMKQIEKLTIY